IANVDRVYFFDLLGAAAGCFVLLAMLSLADGIGTIIGATVTFRTAAAIWFSLAGATGARARSVMLALGLVAFLIFNQKHEILAIRYAKKKAIANEIFKQ